MRDCRSPLLHALLHALRCLVRLWLGVAGVVAATAACAMPAADAALLLRDEAASIDAWPAVTVHVDATGRLALADVLEGRARFQPPQGPHANLGVRREAVWLRLPVTVPRDGDGRWVLDIDYPSIDRIDVHVVSDGRAVRHVVLGDHLPWSERPMDTRSHAVLLRLERGQSHLLLLRVQTTSSMVLPLRLEKMEAYLARETRLQLLQGMAAGIGLCLVLYAVAHGLGRRDPMFLYYAVLVTGTTGFFFTYHGLAAQLLWPGSVWLTRNMAPFSVLIGLAGSFLLVERMLDVRAMHRRLALAMQAAGAIALGTALLFAADLVVYRTAHVTATLLGPMSVLLAVPVAWLRWRQGDRAAPTMFAGWAVYAVGVVFMAALLRGWVDWSVWSQHAFQAGSMFEALTWLRVLGMRNDEARQRADRADRERELLQTLAHTDALTGLLNRRGLERELSAALDSLPTQGAFAVCMLDLDGFKAVNDRFGHDVGDELLVAVAARLRHELRQRDVVARLGGDEFVVLARDLGGEQDAWQIGRKLVAALGEPFALRGHACSVGLTLGFALAPADGADASTLLRAADAAMYAGKAAGKGTVRRGGPAPRLAGSSRAPAATA